MPDTYHNYVDGAWIEAATGETFEVRNPASPAEVVGEFQESGADDAARAVEAAAAAQPAWADTPGPERGRYLQTVSRHLADRKDDLAETLTREEGKTLRESEGEVQRAIDIFAYYGQKAREVGGTVASASRRDTRLYTVNEPLGVAGLITPWNYPIAIPCWKLAPALATGNTGVLKPAEVAPTVMAKVFEALDAAGLPDGVANFVTGPGDAVGGTLVSHDAVDVVSFTGSQDVGTQVYRQATADGKRAQTEMGSKNPTVVMPSCDVEDAVSIVGSGAFGVTGQACTATSRAIVHEDVYDEFVDGLVTYAENLELGPGLAEADMGPKASQDELDNTLDYVEVGRDEGATVATGGERPTGESVEEGYFVEPTVFTDVDPEMRIMQEEIFGPVVGVYPVSSLGEALEVANGVEYGLSASILTRDHSEANRFVDDAAFGVIKVNGKTTGLELHVPFGGLKGSSSETFREQGEAALDFYTITKTVYEGYEPAADLGPAVDTD